MAAPGFTTGSKSSKLVTTEYREALSEINSSLSAYKTPSYPRRKREAPAESLIMEEIRGDINYLKLVIISNNQNHLF